MSLKQHVAIKLHGWALRLCPELVDVVRAQVVGEVLDAARGQLTAMAVARQVAEHQQTVAARAQRQ